MVLFLQTLKWLAVGIGAVGALVVAWGVLVGIVLLVKTEIARLSGANVDSEQVALRQRVGYYLLLGLEFLLAADIVETIRAPSLEHLAVLAGIVVIRTVISASLAWELRHGLETHPSVQNQNTHSAPRGA